jgi:hypothetical protein
MTSEDGFWYRVGYALERARRPSTRRERGRLAGLTERASEETLDAAEERAESNGSGGFLSEQLVTAGVAALAGRLLDVWEPKRSVRFSRLLWAGAAGAAAALLVDAVRPFLRGEPNRPVFDRATADRLIAGVSQGLLYGAVIEPRVPGPTVLKGALFGSAEYAADAAGGLVRLLREHTPHGRLPVVGRMLEEIDPHDRVYLEHLAFGIALAVFCGSAPSSNGAEDDEAGDGPGPG